MPSVVEPRRGDTRGGTVEPLPIHSTGELVSAFIHVRNHLIWSTNGRTPSIRPEWRDDLYAYISGICNNVGCKLLLAGGMPDHVHLYVSFDATHSRDGQPSQEQLLPMDPRKP